MLKFENTVTLSPEQWRSVIMGARNPLNSWERSDSEIKLESWHDTSGGYFEAGPNDHDLMMRLAKGGPVHAKYRRMIAVYVDITAPLYWWKEFDTYKVGTVANSCSIMHKIAEKEFTLEDFSCEHLERRASLTLARIVGDLNFFRTYYLRMKEQKTPFANEKAKQIWWQMIQLLPSSYNQKRTVMLNYEVLAGIYPMRKDHKLDEWREFCKWIEGLPYSEIIIGEEKE